MNESRMNPVAFVALALCILAPTVSSVAMDSYVTITSKLEFPEEGANMIVWSGSLHNNTIENASVRVQFHFYDAYGQLLVDCTPTPYDPVRHDVARLSSVDLIVRLRPKDDVACKGVASVDVVAVARASEHEGESGTPTRQVSSSPSGQSGRTRAHRQDLTQQKSRKAVELEREVASLRQEVARLQESLETGVNHYFWEVEMVYSYDAGMMVPRNRNVLGPPTGKLSSDWKRRYRDMLRVKRIELRRLEQQLERLEEAD